METTPQEKRSANLTALKVSSDALIEKWGADLLKFQSAIDEGRQLQPEDKRRYQFLKAFLVVSLDRKKEAASCSK
jgi:hypothetical protein